MRKSLIARSVALIGGALLSATTFAKQPNILVIWGDDIGWQNVSAYGMGKRWATLRPILTVLENRGFGLPITMPNPVQLQAVLPLLQGNIRFVAV